MGLAEFFGLLFVGIGVFFAVVGVIGIIRLPDVYSRIHASGKVSTLGILSLLLGTVFLLPEVLVKAAALALFLLISSPVVAHVVALAAHRLGVKRSGAVRDDLAARSRTASVGEPREASTSTEVTGQQA